MKKLKYIIIFLMIMVLSGCGATSQVTLLKSGTVKEKVTILEENLKVQYGNHSLEESVSQAIAEYDDALNTRKYTTDIKVYDEKSGVIVTNNYNNMCDYLQKTIFTQYLYKHINCKEDKGYYTIDSVGNYITRDTYYDTWNVPSTMIYKVTLPFKATENNADKINGKTNTYTWIYNTKTQASKSLHLKISKSSIENAKKDYEKEQQDKIKKQKIVNIIVIFVSVLALVVLGYIVYRVLYKKYKENKIDY